MRLIQGQLYSVLEGKIVQRWVALQSGHPAGVGAGAPNWPTPIALMDTSQNPISAQSYLRGRYNNNNDKLLWRLLVASGAMHICCMPNNDDDDTVLLCHNILGIKNKNIFCRPDCTRSYLL